MSLTNDSYHGLDIVPLIYLHRGSPNTGRHSYDTRFDASVKIFSRRPDVEDADVRVFLVSATGSFGSIGDARRASIYFAEQLIDREVAAKGTVDLQDLEKSPHDACRQR